MDVLIVGGGPVGLTARALLERWGVRTLLVEKHGELSPFPRSRLINVRSMEIFRQLGLAETVTARAFAPAYGRICFRDTLFDHDFASAAMLGIDAPIPESPVTGVVTSQDRLEPTLLAAADSEMRFGVELTNLIEEPEGVVAVLVDRQRGGEARVQARYVLAADGANSTVRQRLRIDTAGPGAVGRATTVVFQDAAADRMSAAQPAGVYATARGSFLPLYPEGGMAWVVAPSPDDAEHADWSALVSRAIGLGDGARVDVLRVQHWIVNAFVAQRFHQGRVLLAGDAAHAIPPAGGLGLNVGIADVHNLCWKLAGVLQGWAGPHLLESYGTERQPVAQEALRQAVANSQALSGAQRARQEQLRAGDAAPAEIELPWSEAYFAQLGFVLGVAYRSDAILSEDSDRPETGTNYIPTTTPGGRLPHAWLAPGCSTLDAVGEWFSLLTPDPARWEDAAAGAWPLRIECLPEGSTELSDLGSDGALLVRPDGHVGARWRQRPPGDGAVGDALAAMVAWRR